MTTTEMKISDIKPNPSNPRLIKDEKFKRLVESVKNFPEMLRLRPIVVNEANIIIGGNMRWKAAKEAGYKTVPVTKAVGLTEEQEREFIIKDNVGFGEWDWEMLANEWESEKLAEWGLDTIDIEQDEEIKNADIQFSEEIDIENNYIVLKFSKDIDWIQIQSILGIASTYSKRQNGKPWSKGVGRVIDGVDAILKIKESANEG